MPDHFNPNSFSESRCPGSGLPPITSNTTCSHTAKNTCPLCTDAPRRDPANIHFYDQPRTPMHHERLREAIEAQSRKPMEVFPPSPAICTANVQFTLGSNYHGGVKFGKPDDYDSCVRVSCKASEMLDAIQAVEEAKSYLDKQERAARTISEADEKLRKALEKAAA